ncbi:hypothetical protein LJC59_09825, partial [Desulfovibrio sp. OttesenSCG-928-A18]|nr:hypothetical protein [Desulfovibrio sp. OttesenSCG-928-A18]
MSQSTPNQPAPRTVALQKPAAGTRVVLSNLAGTTLKYEFEVSEPLYARQGNSIVITFPDGAVLVLENFLADRDNVPNFEVSGELVDGIAMLESLKINTARGPARPATPRGSGVGDYDAESGDLIRSVDRMDDLGSNRRDWDNSTLYGGKELSDPLGPLPYDISIGIAFRADSPLNEAHMAMGTDPQPEGAITPWTVVQLPANVFIVGVPQDPNEPPTEFQDDNGTLYVRYVGPGEYEYRYEMTTPFSSDGEGRDLLENATSFTLPISDGGLGSGTIVIAIDVLDDMPETDMLADNDNTTTAWANIGTWAVDLGADERGAEGGVTVQITYVDADGTELVFTFDESEVAFGQKLELYQEDADGNRVYYGTLILNSSDDPDGNVLSGSYEFRSAPNRAGEYTLTVSAKDADGDVHSSSEVFNLTDPVWDGPHLGSGKDEWFSEKNIVADPSEGRPYSGTEADGTQATKDIKLPDGYTINTADWTQNADGTWKFEGDNGYLTYTDSVPPRLTYTVTLGADHTGGDGYTAYDFFGGSAGSPGTITLTDWAGNNVKVPVQITVYDDEPKASLREGESGDDATSGMEYLGAWDVIFGADGPADSGSLVFVIEVDGKPVSITVDSFGHEYPVRLGNTEYGTLTVNDNGTFVFKPAPETGKGMWPGQVTITVKGTDADTDTAVSGSITINVDTPPTPPAVDIWVKDRSPVNEANLPGGTDPSDEALTKELGLPDGYGIAPVAEDGWSRQSGTDIYIKTIFTSDNKPVGQLIYDQANNTLYFKLTGPFPHDAPGGDFDAYLIAQIGNLDLSLVVTDGDGDTATSDPVRVELDVYDWPNLP